MESRATLDARVVDEDVDGAELVHHAPEHRLHLSLARDVGAMQERVRARPANLRGGCLGLFLVRDVIQDDVGPRASQRDSGGETDARARTGDQRFLSRKECPTHTL